MAAYNKFQDWVARLCEGDAAVDTDSFELALTAAANAPSASLDAVLADLTQIAYTNLNSPFVLTTSTASETTGTYTLLFADEVISASGGAGAAFRYVCMFDQTVAAPVVDPLMGWYDYGSDLTLNDGDSLTVDWTGNTWTLA